MRKSGNNQVNLYVPPDSRVRHVHQNIYNSLMRKYLSLMHGEGTSCNNGLRYSW